LFECSDLNLFIFEHWKIFKEKGLFGSANNQAYIRRLVRDVYEATESVDMNLIQKNVYEAPILNFVVM
jgi:hypothetical protein